MEHDKYNVKLRNIYMLKCFWILKFGLKSQLWDNWKIT